MSTNTHFHESSIHFTFSESWNIIAFDKTKFYRRMSGLGVKGVDFLGIYEDQLYLIEIKNFTQYKKIDQNRFDFEGYTSNIITKFEDTLRVIKLVNKHYERKIGHKLIDWLYRRYPNIFSKGYSFWKEATKLMNTNPSDIHLVLWMEHDFDASIIETTVKRPLKEYFKGSSHSFEQVNHSNYTLSDLTIEPKLKIL